MAEAVTLQVSGPHDPDRRYDDPPAGVSIVGSTKRMSFHGEDILTLSLLVQAVGVNLLAEWIWDTFVVSRRATSKEITINGNVYIVFDVEALERVLQDVRTH